MRPIFGIPFTDVQFIFPFLIMNPNRFLFSAGFTLFMFILSWKFVDVLVQPLTKQDHVHQYIQVQDKNIDGNSMLFFMRLIYD